MGKMFFPLASLKFLLCLWFSATWTWPSSFDVYFAWWSQLPGSVVWCLTLMGGNSQSWLLHVFFCSFLSSPPVSLIRHILHLFSCLTCLGCSVPIFSGFFLFTSQILKLPHIFKHRNSSLSPSKAFFISVTVFFFLFFFFWARAFLFIFRISICLLTLPAYSCMLSTFYIRAPSVWMVVVLLIDSQWDNSNISALSGSGSDAWSSSSNCVFCLLVYLASFLLKVKFGTLNFKNCYKWAFGLPR